MLRWYGGPRPVSVRCASDIAACGIPAACPRRAREPSCRSTRRRATAMAVRGQRTFSIISAGRGSNCPCDPRSGSAYSALRHVVEHSARGSYARCLNRSLREILRRELTARKDMPAIAFNPFRSLSLEHALWGEIGAAEPRQRRRHREGSVSIIPLEVSCSMDGNDPCIGPRTREQLGGVDPDLFTHRLPCLAITVQFLQVRIAVIWETASQHKCTCFGFPVQRRGARECRRDRYMP